MKIQKPMFIRTGATIEHADPEDKTFEPGVKSYKYINEAKRTSRKLTSTYGLGSVRKG